MAFYCSPYKTLWVIFKEMAKAKYEASTISLTFELTVKNPVIKVIKNFSLDCEKFK